MDFRYCLSVWRLEIGFVERFWPVLMLFSFQNALKRPSKFWNFQFCRGIPLLSPHATTSETHQGSAESMVKLTYIALILFSVIQLSLGRTLLCKFPTFPPLLSLDRTLLCKFPTFPPSALTRSDVTLQISHVPPSALTRSDVYSANFPRFPLCSH